jgi:hypothetical protein
LTFYKIRARVPKTETAMMSTRIKYLSIPQAGLVLGKTKQWAAKMARQGLFGEIVRVGESPLRRVSVAELEKRFGPISADALFRAVAHPNTGE